MNNKDKLTQYTRFSGCGAKLGIDVMDKALCGLEQPAYPNLLGGFSGYEDAGLYRIDDENILVQTVDFFPPIVDDAFLFGRIAAANALSDVYSMGAKPISALALVCYPVKELGINGLKEMMNGGLDALKEAGCALLGGHSIEDSEPKLGYAVTGLVSKEKIWKNNALKKDAKLILTKPIGTGIINMALKAECASEAEVQAAQNSMASLNKKSSEILRKYPVCACTDVTGFGLVGHLAEMVDDAEVGARLFVEKIPKLPNIEEYVSMGLVPEGTWRNRKGRGHVVKNLKDISPIMSDIIFDPQTSGGLLACVPNNVADEALKDLLNSGINAEIVGQTGGKTGEIEIVS
jgi:selenide,water dikinase